jgi:hypothetical protein
MTELVIPLEEYERQKRQHADWENLNGASPATPLIGAAFAFGEEQVSNPGAYSFGGSLGIHENPLQWLQADRGGIVVLDWKKAFDRLRHVPKVTVPQALLRQYRQAMNPSGPQVMVATEKMAA